VESVGKKTSKTDRKLTDNLLLPSPLWLPFPAAYSCGNPPVITEYLQGEAESETDV